MKNEKTSVESSHSLSSNIKLTLICIVLALSVSVLWVSVFLKPFVGTGAFFALFGIGAAVTLVFAILLVRFHR